MRLEDGCESIFVRKTGVNQDKINRFLAWCEGQGFTVYSFDPTRYELDGISEECQQEVQRYFESLGRVYKKRRSAQPVCDADGCINEPGPRMRYCPAHSKQVRR